MQNPVTGSQAEHIGPQGLPDDQTRMLWKNGLCTEQDRRIRL